MTASADPITVDRPRTRREIYTVMSGLMIAMLLAMLDNLIVGTALPTIVGDLGGLAHLSWVVTAYALATAVSTPVWAKLGDLFGRKGVFMASIVVFLVGSALSGLAQDMGQLIAFRGLQGVGAGGLMVGAIAIIGDLVPPRERGRYQGLMAAVMPLAFIGGPLLGGFLTDNLSWRWAFYINLPLGALALVVVALTMHLPGRRPGPVTIDWWGAGLLGTGISALTLLASWGGNQYDWGSWQIMGLLALTVVALVAFVLVERRVEEPILSLELFRGRNFTAAIAMTFVIGFAMFGAVTFLPQFQQNVQGASATGSGLLLLPLMGGMLTTSLLGGQLVTRTGRYRAMLIAGAALMVVGLGLLATMDVTTGTARHVALHGRARRGDGDAHADHHARRAEQRGAARPGRRERRGHDVPDHRRLAGGVPARGPVRHAAGEQPQRAARRGGRRADHRRQPAAHPGDAR